MYLRNAVASHVPKQYAIYDIILLTIYGELGICNDATSPVPIESPLVVSYLTSIVSNIVSLTVFEIFDAKIL